MLISPVAAFNLQYLYTTNHEFASGDLQIYRIKNAHLASNQNRGARAGLAPAQHERSEDTCERSRLGSLWRHLKDSNLQLLEPSSETPSKKNAVKMCLLLPVVRMLYVHRYKYWYWYRYWYCITDTDNDTDTDVLLIWILILMLIRILIRILKRILILLLI